MLTRQQNRVNTFSEQVFMMYMKASDYSPPPMGSILSKVSFVVSSVVVVVVT